MSKVNFDFLDKNHFNRNIPISYDDVWIMNEGVIDVLQDNMYEVENENGSWSSEIEEIHEEPTQKGWIDVYERERVIRTAAAILNEGNKVVVEFGASIGYMIEEMKNMFPNNQYIATDIMMDGLKQSYARNQSIQHIRCDFTNAPFKTDSIDFVYSLNVLEHIEDDVQTIEECWRILKPGGYCLFVVPRGKKLYDYYDEMLFHKRRYAKGELRSKCIAAGFEVKESFHYAWLCYPAFWLKKKYNRIVSKRLTRDEKIDRVKKDIENANESFLAIKLMHFEHILSKAVHASFGVREFILCQKEI